MNAEKRDELLLKIAGDAEATKSTIESHTKMVGKLFEKFEDHDQRITTVETIQRTCPAAAAMRPQSVANKIAMVGVIIVVILGLISTAVALYTNYKTQNKIEQIHPTR